jgi:hypothetical protein
MYENWQKGRESCTTGNGSNEKKEGIIDETVRTEI